jgi:hypothetical protein
VDSAILTDKGTSTGWHNICCGVMQLTSMLKTRAAYSANLQVLTRIDQNNTILEIIITFFICIIKEKCSDQEESKLKC